MQNVTTRRKMKDETLVSRRNFLKSVGFSVAGSMVSCSQMPVEKAIPYLIQPDNIVPGKAYWYASTCGACASQCGTVVKTREGRPIKIEGNGKSEVSKGGLCAKGQASVLDLYDSGRLQGPFQGETAVEWDALDASLLDHFDGLRKRGGRVRVLSNTVSSPTLKHVIDAFLSGFSDGKHVMYDPVSYSGLIHSQRECFGVKAAPHFHFDRADLILSFGADFLGSWLSPIEFAKGYSQRRSVDNPKSKMSRHVQFESRMSMTGANADERVTLKPSELRLAIVSLLEEVEKSLGVKSTTGTSDTLLQSVRNKVKPFVKELLSARGASLVISSSNRKDVQNIVARINELLGNYGRTISLSSPSFQRTGDDVELEKFFAEVKAEKVDALILVGANPIYDLPLSDEEQELLKKVELIVSLNPRKDETAQFAHYLVPDHHTLESWGDHEPIEGVFHLAQPVVHPIYKTRQAGDSFLKWERRETPFRKVLEDYWEKNILPSKGLWKQALHDGVFRQKSRSGSKKFAFKKNVSQDVQGLLKSMKAEPKADFEIELFEPVTIGEGRLANNPWLQELPDPISKVAWDNVLFVSKMDAKKLKINTGHMVSIQLGKHSLEVPVLIQPGQASGAVSLALGYGRTHAGKAGNGVGVNAYPWLSFDKSGRQFEKSGVRVEALTHTYPLARTQTHDSKEGRPIVHELTHDELGEGKHLDAHNNHGGVMLWESHHPEGENWGMAIDLNACIGCSGCLVGCQAENNIPVVGKEEVRNRREMSWIRIDRYYEGEENPQVQFQPMLCQHCGNAPCESVCPVLATVHSSDGLNQQVYNRCIGTRYCANNCPYKVRRFNWFDYAQNEKFNYHLNDDVGRLVLNPDIVVRSRGVMEKCSFCVQRIQGQKLEAKKNGETLNSDDVKTACQQSCPTDAIVFGDLNDPTSKVSKVLSKNPRSFQVLAELNVQPSVSYLAKVRNKKG